MAGRLKINWKSARAQYESGHFSCYRIAQEYGISKQAVLAQKSRHNWTKIEDQPGNIDALPILPISGKYLSLQSRDKFDDDMALALLNAAGAGYPDSVCSQYVGITSKTLKSYLDSSDTFRADFLQRRAQFHAKHIANIDSSSERDFRASLELLKAGKVEGYGIADNDSRDLTVHISIDRSPLPEESPMIDITPDT